MTNPISLFQKPSKPVYLKAGLYGGTGSGKTYTAGKMAIGMVKSLKSKKPVTMFDTETGSDFLIPMFEEAGIELLVIKSRSFAKLVQATDEAEKISDVFIIDSIAHVWDEAVEAYKTKKNRKFIQINEWGEIKAIWGKFTKSYLNAKQNIILCSRAQDITENSVDEKSGQKDFSKIGERMRGEKYMGYEPSLLIRMESIQDLKRNKVTHMAYVEKDRTANMTGESVAEPTFESFQRVWDAYDHDGESEGIDDADSVSTFDDPDYSFEDMKQRRLSATESIKNIFIKNDASGSGSEEKKKRLDLLEKFFGTDNWVDICQDMPVKVDIKKLEEGVNALDAYFTKEKGISVEEAKKQLLNKKKGTK